MFETDECSNPKGEESSLCHFELFTIQTNAKSRVMGDYQARFRERLGVKFPLPTRSMDGLVVQLLLI